MCTVRLASFLYICFCFSEPFFDFCVHGAAGICAAADDGKVFPSESLCLRQWMIQTNCLPKQTSKTMHTKTQSPHHHVNTDLLAFLRIFDQNGSRQTPKKRQANLWSKFPGFFFIKSRKFILLLVSISLLCRQYMRQSLKWQRAINNKAIESFSEALQHNLFFVKSAKIHTKCKILFKH